MQRIVFTICCNNYLAQAKVLANSIREKSVGWEFFIVLVDRKNSDIDYDFGGNAHVIEIEQIKIPDFAWMSDNYGVIELSTAVKADVFLHFHTQYDESVVLYLDPDICVYQSLDLVFEELNGNSFVLTPHCLSPIPLDRCEPQENLFLNHGVYNLGFAASSGDSNAISLLLWWAERLRKHAFIDLKEGYFTDQIWMNLAPIFFKGVKIVTHPGFNVAYWNLHERSIETREGDYVINGHFPLVFFHYSSVDREGMKLAWRGTDRFDFQNRPELYGLFRDYLTQINANSTDSIKNAMPFFEVRRLKYLYERKGRLSFVRRVLITCRRLVGRITPQIVKNALRDSR